MRSARRIRPIRPIRRISTLRTSRTTAGFTMLEVMVGLALLALALTVLLKSAAGSIFNAKQAQMMGVVTDLSRAKMYDIEEILLKDGFTDTNQSQDSEQDFSDEGWASVKYSYKVDQVELPSWDKLQDLSKSKAGSGSGGSAGSPGSGGSAGADFSGSGGFQDSALGGMMSMLGGGFGGAGSGSGNVDSQMGASFVQSQYALVQRVLKESIRKVTLTVTYEVMGRKRDLTTVAFFTDPAAMDKALQGLGSQELPDDGGTGTGTGTGTGSGKGTGKRPTGKGTQ